MEYILSHDLGTSGNKATLFSTNGKMIKSETVRYSVSYPEAFQAEQDPDDWWRAVIDATRRLTENIDAKDIIAVSFSGQMMGCVCVDESGEPLRPAVIWADMRAQEEEKTIGERISRDEFYHITGHRLSPSYGGQKFMWVKNHEPEVYSKTYKTLNAKDYIILKLTNNFVTEYTDASSTCLLDLERLCWSERLIDAMGVDKDKLPELHKSTDIAGRVSKKAAELTGLLEGTPVICGGGDGVCAAIGTGCIEEGIAHSSMGTSSWISITSKKPVYDEKQRTFTWAHIIPGYVLPTGTMQTGGGAYAWYTDEFCKYERKTAEEKNCSVYDILEDELKKSPLGANGLIFLPYLLGERSPRWNPDAKGAFIGLSMTHKKQDMLRAVQEGVAMNLNIILGVFRSHGQNINDMVVVGGGAKSASWQRILSDVFGMKLSFPDYTDEATAMGAAITAGVGVGAFSDFHAAEKFFRIQKTVEPIAENVKKYETVFQTFDAAYEALLPIYEKLK